MGKNLLNFCGKSLCSQPTMSKLETAHWIEIVRMMTAMVDLFRASFERPPAAITLYIDDTHLRRMASVVVDQDAHVTPLHC